MIAINEPIHVNILKKHYDVDIICCEYKHSFIFYSIYDMRNSIESFLFHFV